MTQLIIDGREAVLPQNLSVTVKRENSFFTKSGEYTYDLTLQLDNETNLSLYGFLSRVTEGCTAGARRSSPAGQTRLSPSRSCRASRR